MATLTNGADYKIRNLAFSKYIKGNAGSPNVLGHYTYNANDTNFEFEAVGVVLLVDTYYKLKNGSLFWTVPASGDGQLTLETELSTTANAYYRQLFQLIEVTAGVVMLAPRSAPNSRVQLAGPLVDEGRYLQLFSTQTNASNEQFAFELLSGNTVVDTPAVRQPVYSHHTSIFVENVETGATIQVYLNGQAFGPQRTNNSAGTATIEVPISGLSKGNSITVDAFKSGETPAISAQTKVEEGAMIVRVREPNGSVTFNVEIAEILSGSTAETASAQRFASPRILTSGLASAAAAESFRDNLQYVRTQL